MLTEEFSRRFDQASLALPAAIEDILVKAINNTDESPIVVPDIVTEAYSKDINMKRLEKQLQMLPDLASAYKTSQSLEVLKVTSVRMVCEIRQSIPVAQEMFCETDKLLRIYLTIPISTATAERSFSALRHI